MRKVRMLMFVGAVAVVGSLAACTFFPLTITQTADGSLEAMSVGGKLMIKLAGNPSTGFGWYRVSPESLDGTPLEIIEEASFEPGESEIVGAPGTCVFKYRAVEAGTVTLDFEYKRTWEESVSDTFSIVIWVR